MRIADLHLHLNGSFSLAFLQKTAQKHQCLEIYHELARVNRLYAQRTAAQPDVPFSAEVVALIWQQFDLIHRIVHDLEDITAGVVDVVTHSTAHYLEIRTTPKPMAGQSLAAYITAFEAGLLSAQQTIPDKKAVGLLSLDRTLHRLDDAQYFIDRINASPHKLLVGLDLSGNPLAPRTLTGATLSELVRLALTRSIPLALHIGEVDSAIEQQDTHAILAAVAQWQALQSTHPTNPLHGLLRLGHCIFLTPEHQATIARLGIPIEICPSCHKKLNWHKAACAHPATAIYPDLSDPVVVGTDDALIFGGSAYDEFHSLLGFFANRKALTNQALTEHQAGFRFS